MCKMTNCLKIEKIVLIALLIVVWGLLGIPLTFHFLNKDRSSTSLCLTAITPEDDSVCHEVFLVHGSSEKNFSILESNSMISVARNASKETKLILDEVVGFSSEECAEVLIPFLCKYYYELVCDEEGKTSTASHVDCLNISNGVCQEVWSMLDHMLPHCDTLPGSNFQFDITSDDKDCPSECTAKFFCNSRDGKCVPRCPDWNFYSTTATAVLDIAIASASIVGVIAGVSVIIVSCIRRQTVFSFPSVLVFYETITMLICISFQLMTFLDREYLYCTSTNLLETFQSSTPFCIISGAIQTVYIPMQFNIWWVTHTLVLFWAIGHPFEAKQFKTKKRFRTAHIIIVVTGILVPMIPVLAIILHATISSLEKGTFGIGLLMTPPLLCITLNQDSFFYFILLPNAFLTVTGITGLSLTLWKIHRKYGIIKSIRERHNNTTIGTAEKKLLLIICYFIFLEAVYYLRAPQGDPRDELQAYFICEQDGVNPDSPCSRSGFENPIQLFLSVLFYCLAILIPVVNLIFVIDCSDMKKSVRKLVLSRKSAAD